MSFLESMEVMRESVEMSRTATDTFSASLLAFCISVRYWSMTFL